MHDALDYIDISPMKRATYARVNLMGMFSMIGSDSTLTLTTGCYLCSIGTTQPWGNIGQMVCMTNNFIPFPLHNWVVSAAMARLHFNTSSELKVKINSNNSGREQTKFSEREE